MLKTRRECFEAALEQIKLSKKYNIKLKESVYKDAVKFMQSESDIQFKMDNDEFKYIEIKDKLK